MSEVVNNYAPPALEDLSTYYGPEPYDLNFVFPVHLPALESARVKLVPFVPKLHAQAYMDQIAAHPQLQRWLPLDHLSLAEVLSFVERRVRRDPAWIAFAVIDKMKPDPANEAAGGNFAGVIALLNANAQSLVAEIGWVLTFPAFQRTHVTSNTVGILLRYCLELPTHRTHPGLGLRRVQWTANPRNVVSIKTAEKMGLKMEGVIRWSWVLEEGKEGNEKTVREGDPRGRLPGRDSALLSICQDDWENGGRERVRAIIDRQ